MKTEWSKGEAHLIDHAKNAEARIEDLTSTVLAEVRGYKNPVIRLNRAQAVLNLEPELIAERRTAVLDLQKLGWSWPKIGSLLGVSPQAAQQISKRTRTVHPEGSGVAPQPLNP